MVLIPWGTIQAYFLKRPPVGDLVDKIHHTIVPSILLTFCLMISTKQWVGSPIQCWLPKEFSNQWSQYAEDYCFIHETYFTRINSTRDLTDEEKRQNSAGYYQWVPIFLTLSAFFFYVPFFLYQHFIKKRAGLDVEKYVEEAVRIKNGKLKERKDALNVFVDDLASQVESKSSKRNYFDAVFMYLMLKVIFCVNLIAQIYHMNVFLGHESLWALSSLFDMYEGRSWDHKGYFPRVTFCDFKIRDLANTRPYSIQCVLVINMFNEKVYLFLWSFYVVLFVVTVCNLFYTVYNFYYNRNLTAYIQRMLEDSDGKQLAEFDPKTVDRYTHITLGKEVLLTLRLIEAHTDRRLCVLINRALYDKTKTDEQKNGDIDPKTWFLAPGDKKPQNYV